MMVIEALCLRPYSALLCSTTTISGPRCRTPVNLRERWRNPRHHRPTRLPDQKWVDICHCTVYTEAP